VGLQESDQAQRELHPHRKTYEAIVHCIGGTATIPGKEKKVHELLAFAQQRAPWAMYGFSDELAALFNKRRQEFARNVEQRRKEWAQSRRSALDGGGSAAAGGVPGFRAGAAARAGNSRQTPPRDVTGALTQAQRDSLLRELDVHRRRGGLDTSMAIASRSRWDVSAPGRPPRPFSKCEAAAPSRCATRAARRWARHASHGRRIQ